MELHTFGVDGGYTQKDIEGIARVFTEWTNFPNGDRGDKIREKIDKGIKVWFIQQNDFLFRADVYDA